MLRRKRHHISVGLGERLAHLIAFRFDARHGLLSRFQHLLTGSGQSHGMPGSIHQSRANPRLEGLDTPTEGWLADIPEARGLREISGLGKIAQILEPGDVQLLYPSCNERIMLGKHTIGGNPGSVSRWSA